MMWDITKALPESSQPALGPGTRGFHLNEHSGLTNAPDRDAAATVRFRSPRGRGRGGGAMARRVSHLSAGPQREAEAAGAY